MTTMENLLDLLPDGWEKACFDFHAIERKRKIRKALTPLAQIKCNQHE